MKLQGLSIIFIIIIMPIVMVLSEYVNNKIEIAQAEIRYDTKLLNSTYDAVKAFQLNTVNNSVSDVATSKIEDMEAAANTFYNSLATNFNYIGYKSKVMQEYVPAIVFTLYDGYYVYSPYVNTLTTVKDRNGEPELKTAPDYFGDDANVSKEYENGKTLEGLKPNVYYSCRYKRTNGDDFIISYTLDNYITIQGMINNNYINDSGYLVDGITKISDTEYKYDDISFKEDDTEVMEESLAGSIYKYVKINGIKYYLKEETDTISNEIFFIDKTGFKNYSQVSHEPQLKQKFINAINNNKSAFEYYKNAYKFTKRVKEVYGLSDLRVSDAYIYSNGAKNTTAFSEGGDFEIFGGGKEIQKGSSNFNRHRQSVIRYVIETNLSASIASYSSNAKSSFIMPKIAEDDWELIENDVCFISFLQGLPLDTKIYNSYAVVANTLTKEYVDENDIYIISDDTYYKPNDKELLNRRS